MSKSKTCPDCETRLCRAGIYDIELKAWMGWVWECDECCKKYIGFGDPFEYDGKPKDEKAAEKYDEEVAAR